MTCLVRPIAQVSFPATPDYFPLFLIVSTTAVFGRLCAVVTEMNFPLPASRPILVPFANSLTSLGPTCDYSLRHTTDKEGATRRAVVVAQRSTFR